MPRGQVKKQPSEVVSLPDSAWRQSFRRRLRGWYQRMARDLPWRRGRDPYHVWVSEIMLQQTQVATVEGYFGRFLKAFPTVVDLAAAEEESVLRQWEGLGYYRRARQMHAAAKQIVSEHGGRFPRELTEILALPGIGRYTAGAIASIAFDTPAPILEANTIRLFSRLVGYGGDPTNTAGQRVLWEFAEAILPRRDSGTFNQALMELGSLVCTPKGPECTLCPVATLCPTLAAGWQDQIPRAKRRPKIEAVREAAIVVRGRGRVLLRRCAAGERWAGLWDFPRFAISNSKGNKLQRELAEKLNRATEVHIEQADYLTTIKHGVTRYRITLECFQAKRATGSNGAKLSAEFKWLRPAELESLPLSVTGRKIGKLIAQ